GAPRQVLLDLPSLLRGELAPQVADEGLRIGVLLTHPRAPSKNAPPVVRPAVPAYRAPTARVPAPGPTGRRCRPAPHAPAFPLPARRPGSARRGERSGSATCPAVEPGPVPSGRWKATSRGSLRPLMPLARGRRICRPSTEASCRGDRKGDRGPGQSEN